MGIQKNIYWTDLAQNTVFDVLRVNNLPRLDNDSAVQSNFQEFADPQAAATPQRQPTVRPAPPRIDTYAIHGGTVQASSLDPDGLVGEDVAILNNFWKGYEEDFNSTVCPVVARCVREFRHPNGQRTTTYIIEWNGTYFPIQKAALMSCLSPEQRRQRR